MSLEDTSSNMFLTQLHLNPKVVKKNTDDSEVIQTYYQLRVVKKDVDIKDMREEKEGDRFEQLKT